MRKVLKKDGKPLSEAMLWKKQGENINLCTINNLELPEYLWGIYMFMELCLF